MSENEFSIETNEVKYSPNTPGEQDRLRLQAELLRDFDSEIFQAARKRFRSPPKFGLDLGCSRGYASFDRFEPLGLKKVLGIDIDEESLRIAEKRSKGYSIEYEFKRASLQSEEEIREALESYLAEVGDKPILVWSAFVFHFFIDPTNILRIFKELLPSGSIIVLRTVDDMTPVFYPNPENLLEEISLRGYPDTHDVERLHARKLPSQMIGAGLVDPEMLSNSFCSTNMNSAERQDAFFTWFSFYREIALRESKNQPDDKKFMRRYDARMKELESLFQEDEFFFFLSFFGAIARVP